MFLLSTHQERALSKKELSVVAILEEFCHRFNLCDRTSVAISVFNLAKQPVGRCSFCLLAVVLPAAASRSLVLAEQVTSCCLREGRFCTVLSHTSGCFPAFPGRFLSELQAFLTGVQCCCLCSVLPSCYTLRYFFVPAGLAGLFFMVLGDQLLHLMRTSRFARFSFDFQRVSSLSGQLSIYDIASHFYRCLVGFEGVLLPCFPSPHRSLSSSCAQLSSRFQLMPMDDFHGAGRTRTNLLHVVRSFRFARFFQPSPVSFGYWRRYVLSRRFFPFHRSQVAAAMLGFAKQPAGTNRFNCWPKFYLLPSAGFLGTSRT
ncbi:hypothetical protein Salat_0595000 [Sesamum alatum]|uniref:Transmembrane protein n=1 Tax=Sesamum alatum TaxID=300844 RepID=A0AAE1YQI5_9LAMI|nr:hypothetical protein Salat_0595000 [Sesamum alatum]